MTSPERTLVLVVDDNDAGRYNKSRILRQAGFDVAEAETGAAGLRLVAERMPRLVLLDVRLPDIDGWEVCRQIKSAADTASVLVLQMSATFVSQADTARALEGGADACLTEPIEPPVLLATVRALLRVRQAEDALREALAREQAARAAAETANRTKDEFLATLSHELRSPLNAILTWTSLLRSGQLDPARTVRALETIDRNTRLQAKLVDDLLDVSRIISGKMRLDLTLVELSAIVEAALDTLRPAAEAKAIHVEAHVDRTLGPVSGDASRLQQVIWNLLSNAVKFTPKGGRVDIRVEGVSSLARITVSDTGQGVDPAFLPHIFERFKQADASSTRAEGGLGLGLAIVRHLVELHGGTVEVHSPGLGMGTTFTVQLPLPAVRMVMSRGESGEALKARLPGGSLPTLAGIDVLVVDDEDDAREALAAVLEQAGASVRAASSVNEAIALVAGHRPDVIVSDIAMPHEDGYALMRRLPDTRPVSEARVPTIALTAFGSAEDERRILAAGYRACLTKPIEAAELVTAVGALARRPGPA
jgi:signal transduction histidine kinase